MKISIPNVNGHPTQVQCDGRQQKQLLTGGYHVLTGDDGEQVIARFTEVEAGQFTPVAFVDTYFEVEDGATYYHSDDNPLNVRRKNMAFLTEEESAQIAAALEDDFEDFGDLDDQADEEDGDLDLACEDPECFCNDTDTGLEGVVFDPETEDDNLFLVFVEIPSDEEPVYIASRRSRIDASDLHDLVQAAIDGHFGRTNLIQNRDLVERLAAERTLGVEDAFFTLSA